MEKNNLQTTVKQLEEFLSAYYRKTGVRPTLGESLDMMEKDNLLSAPPAVAAADSKVQHTVEEICEIIDSQPVNATAFLQNTSPSESGTAHVSGEDAVFAPGRDVTVTRVFSYLSAAAAEYDYFTLAVVLKGECEFFFAGTPIPVGVGSVIIIPPHTAHIKAVPSDAYVIALHMRRSTFDAQFGDLMTSSDKMSIFFRESIYGENEMNYMSMTANFESGNVLSTLHELVKECASKAPFANLTSVCWTKIFLASVFRTQAGSAAVLRAARDESTRADCGAILQYIQQNYRTVRLSTLARAFHYNETYLSRMLQNYMGMSFTEIVRGIKMTRAEEYLSTSTLRIHDISALVGYDSVDHFSRTFKSTPNMSPQAYRRLTTKRGLRTLAASAVKGESAEKNAKTEKAKNE